MGESREDGASRPLGELDAEDQEFILRLVLASGSLKDLAAHYGVSYPTIRARLDRIIDRLRTILDGRRPDPMAEQLAQFVERGQISSQAARRLLEIHRETLERGKGRSS